MSSYHLLCVSPPATEEVSSPPAREKEGKEGPDIAARKRRSGKGDAPKAKRVKLSEEIPRSTSGELGKNQCRGQVPHRE